MHCPKCSHGKVHLHLLHHYQLGLASQAEKHGISTCSRTSNGVEARWWSLGEHLKSVEDSQHLFDVCKKTRKKKLANDPDHVSHEVDEL